MAVVRARAASTRRARPAGQGRYPWCRNFRAGDLPASIHLGNCAAAAGAHAERFAAHPSQLFAIPDGVSDEAAVLADPVSVSLRSILLAPPPPDGQPVLVYGSGTLAFAAIALLRHLYPDTEVWAATQAGRAGRAGDPARRARRAVVRARRARREVARRVGATPLEPWSKRDWLQDGPAVVYDTIGSAETVETSLRLADTGGTLVDLRRRAAASASSGRRCTSRNCTSSGRTGSASRRSAASPSTRWSTTSTSSRTAWT